MVSRAQGADGVTWCGWCGVRMVKSADDRSATGVDVTVWHRVTKFDARAAALADRHYSRQTRGASQFMPPGRTLVLLSEDELAVWGVCENVDPRGARAWRVTIFRNEGPLLSSRLVALATAETFRAWGSERPAVPLTTEIDPLAVASVHPGYCFKRAGWRFVRRTDGARKGRRDLVVLAAPELGGAS